MRGLLVLLGIVSFSKMAELDIENNLKKKYNLSKIEKEYVYSEDSVSKLNSALLPNIFDIEPKIVILRNIKGKLVGPAVNSLKTTENIYLIIEIEDEQYDGRVKIFKELEKNGCVHNVGFNSLPFDKMEQLLGVVLSKNVKKFLSDYVPKIEHKNKPIYNLNRIFNELKKAKYNLDACQYLVVNPQKYYSIFDITQSLADGKVPLDVIDRYVYDVGSARQVLALIMSEIKIICLIEGRSNLGFSELYKEINEDFKKYDMLEDAEKVGEAKNIHPYRLQKILEKRNSPYFKNCQRNLKLCIEAHNDLSYYYYDNFKLPIIRLCLKMCEI